MEVKVRFCPYCGDKLELSQNISLEDAQISCLAWIGLIFFWECVACKKLFEVFESVPNEITIRETTSEKLAERYLGF